MDMVSKDETEPEKRNEEAMNFQSPNMSSDWQLSSSNLTNASKGMILNSNPMVNSFCASIWDHPTSSSNLGYCDTNIQINPCTTNSLESAAIGLDPLRAGLDRMLGMGWTHPNAMLKGGMFITPTPGMLPQSLPQFPADSGFIERAARFSCFNGGNVGNMMNPLSISESLNPYYKGIKSLSATDHQKQHIGNEAESSNNVSLPFEHGDTERSPLKNERKSESFARSQDEAKQAVGVSGNESDEAECSGQEEVRGESSGKGLGSKKRKRSGQDTELDQMQRAQQPPAEPTKDQTEIQKGEQNLNSPVSKPAGKNGKHGSQASVSPKEDYIHIRARRGQATNSHSLAERVRREKISERMKYLQDLVPGCNKVTGKAVMLDEIINYVQSLQRQVEFLSMKLATVNPRLDFNVDGLLAKDILHLRAGPSSSLAFPPDMTVENYPSLHQPQPGLLQSGIPGLGNHTNALCRSTDTQLATIRGGYKDSSSQVPNVWHDELHNIVQMGLNSNVPLHSQDLSGALPPGQMKAEP